MYDGFTHAPRINGVHDEFGDVIHKLLHLIFRLDRVWERNRLLDWDVLASREISERRAENVGVGDDVRETVLERRYSRRVPADELDSALDTSELYVVSLDEGLRDKD